jgi:uncharacterized membrane protein (UPF0127 family)
MRARAPLLLATLVVALACERTDAPAATSADAMPRTRVTIGVHVIEADVADTPARKQRGLSGRTALGSTEGMLFPYAEPGVHGFWMPDMRFDIDIVWIRAGRIVGVTANASKDRPREVHRPPEPVDLVLELPAGTAARRGFAAGDAVHVEPLAP